MFLLCFGGKKLLPLIYNHLFDLASDPPIFSHWLPIYLVGIFFIGKKAIVLHYHKLKHVKGTKTNLSKKSVDTSYSFPQDEKISSNFYGDTEI